MTFKNDIYANAAFCGFMQGVLQDRDISQISALILTQIGDAAVAFCTEVDSLIAFDADVTVSSVDPSQLLPTTATEQADQQWKAALLVGLCTAVWSGRSEFSTLPGDYLSVSTDIVLAWDTTVVMMTTP